MDDFHDEKIITNCTRSFNFYTYIYIFLIDTCVYRFSYSFLVSVLFIEKGHHIAKRCKFLEM
jgi:hypothetical protein